MAARAEAAWLPAALPDQAGGVRIEPEGTYCLTIPGDRNENHIAGSWESGDENLDHDADDEVVARQDVNGGGITVEEE